MSANFDHYLYCQVTHWQTKKNNEYTNAHHVVVKNDRFINYNIFLFCVSRDILCYF